MDLKDCLILSVIGLGIGGTLLANKANYCEFNTHQLKNEIIELKAEYEGYTKAANQLKP